MSSLLNPYVIMQETEWAGRRFCTARDQRNNQVVYLMGEPLGLLGGSHAHPNLPSFKELGTEGPMRWWVGIRPEGDNLEDLRLQGSLTESELLSALLSTVDALLNLAAMAPSPVPAYLDPACIVRDRIGRWVLDYASLAHAPEAHAGTATPPGVYAFGVLLYWVVTGDTVRRSRVQVSQLESVASPGLQLVIIRCLGRSYPSLAELRAELSRAGKDREFQGIVQRIRAKAKAAKAEVMSTQVKAPHIPMDDRSWAAPPPPKGGYGRGIAPPYQRVGRKGSGARRAALALVTLIVLAVGLGAALKLQLIPAQYLPEWLRPISVVTLFPRPEPMHTVHDTAQMEGWNVNLYPDGRAVGEAYIFASPNYPYMALSDLNSLLGRQIEWVAGPEGQAVLRDGERSLAIQSVEQVGDGLWLKLQPEVQRWLGLRFHSYRSGTLHFSVKA